MAKILSYCDSRGVVYSTSYWRLIYFEVSLENIWASFVFKGFKNKDARIAGLDDVGSIEVISQGQEFLDYYAQYVAGTKNISQIAYEIAESRAVSVRTLNEDNTITVESKVLFDENAVDDL